MRLVFAGTPQVAADTLSHLLDHTDHQVVAVLTRPDAAQGRSKRLIPSPVAQLASSRGIEVLKPQRPLQATSRLAELDAELVVVVAYGALIPASLLGLPPRGWVNIHYSLLPRWRGAAPVQHAIRAGDQITGVTLFNLVPELDAGPILSQAEYRLGDQENTAQALEAMQPLGATLLTDFLADPDRYPPQPQPGAGITLAPRLEVAGARIDWTADAGDIDRQIRACNPAPMTWTTWAGERLRVLEAAPHSHTDLAPGELLIHPRQVLVGCGTGALELGRIQPAGRKPMAATDWARGLREIGRLE